MRPLHALVLVCVLGVLGLGVLWLVRAGDEPVGTAAPVARSEAPAGRPEVRLTAPEQEARAERPESPRVASEVPATEAATAAAAPAARSTGGLRGRVVDALGAPVANARVLAGDGRGLVRLPLDAASVEALPWFDVHEATTDEDGAFALEGPDPGAVRLAVRAPGHAPLDRDGLALPASGDLDVGELVLEPSVLLTGTVVDPRGNAVADARLYRMEPGGEDGLRMFESEPAGALVATTADDGSFRIDELAAGPWELLVRADEHPDHALTGRTDRAGQVKSGLRIVLDEGWTVTGRVTGVPAGVEEPLVVRARAGSPESSDEWLFVDGDAEPRMAECGADGSFVLRGLRMDQGYNLVALRASRRGFGVGRSCSASVHVRPGQSSAELTYQLESAIAFQVVDGRTREPIEDFEVEAGLSWTRPLTDENGRRVRHHEEGRVRFGELRPREARATAKLQLRAAGYQPLDLDDVAVVREETTDLGVLALQPAAVVRVTVVDRTTGAPVEGARVTLSRARGPEQGMRFELSSDDVEVPLSMDEHTRSGRTDAEGVAVVSSFEGERASLRVRRDGYALHRGEELYLTPGQDEELRVELGRGGAVSVLLLDADGAPVAGAQVEHRSGQEDDTFVIAGLGGGTDVTDGEGRVLFDNLEPGEHGFRPAQGGGPRVIMAGGGSASVFISRDGVGAPVQDETWQSVLVEEGGRHDLTLVAPRRVEVFGRVREGGQPLAGATVKLSERDAGPMGDLFGGGEEARTSSDGRYSFPHVEAGSYRLVVTHPDRRMPAERELEVGDAPERLDLELAVSVLEGRVVDEAGEPVSGARVWAERAPEEGDGRRPQVRVMSRFVVEGGGGGGSFSISHGEGDTEPTHSDADGRFSLRGVVPDQDLVVKVQKDAFEPATSERVRAAPDQVVSGVEVTLKPSGAIEVTALEPDGRAGQHLLATARWAGDEDQDVEPRTGFVADGKTVLDGLRPGTWRVSVRRLEPGSSSRSDIAEQTVEVARGETRSVRFDLP